MALEKKLQGLFKKLYKGVLAMAIAMPVGCGGKPNRPPIITSNPQVGEVYEGATFQYDVETKNSDSLTYSLVTAPAGATIDSATGLIKWIPGYKGKGNDYEVNFTVNVQDDNGKSADQNFTLNVKGVNLGDYFDFPGRNLYIAKRQSLHGLNWYEAHKELHIRGARMLTLREFMEFYVTAKRLDGLGNPVSREEVESLPDSWTTEWLDAKFTRVEGSWYIHYNHRFTDGKLRPLNSEQLEKCLMEDCDVDINLRDLTKQGMPTEKENDLRYFAPRQKNEGSVAWFGIFDASKRFAIGCNYNPMRSQVGVGARIWAGESGVREAREKR